MSRQRVEQAIRRHRGSVSGAAIVGLLLLLALPAYALSQLAASVDWRLLVGIPLVVSVLTFVVYNRDKRRAETGSWRIPESTLHLAELAGGWPGAFLAQRILRHKTSKLSYQVEFWIIVFIHQMLAVDSLAGWRIAKGAWQTLKSHIA